ncbi:hypothetical protein Q31b_07020 [Novipirellula aureliae]|uniref:Uncharacterized protein n=2 Tax=Novipirellula aureliae TaxID=2527966 RepID=A0A5C6E9L1_9BACT|nr:hypothetical protein Q31b_07020 [Novipirellula aureliae]
MKLLYRMDFDSCLFARFVAVFYYLDFLATNIHGWNTDQAVRFQSVETGVDPWRNNLHRIVLIRGCLLIFVGLSVVVLGRPPVDPAYDC